MKLILLKRLLTKADIHFYKIKERAELFPPFLIIND
jgi:hypothetical protein